MARYDEYANITGSVNTVKIEEDSSLTGYNTDVFGFVRAIPEDIDLTNKKAVIMGTGGAARSVVAGLYEKGISEIDIYTRNVINSADTIKRLRNIFPTIKIKSVQNSLMGSLDDVSILVNTTPVGMKNFEENNCPIKDENLKTMPEDSLVYDIVYNPLQTALISKAIKYNRRYITGIDMLIWQAIRAFEIWIGKKPDFNLIKSKLYESILINKT